MKSFTRINHQIKASEVRVIDDNGENIGVMSLAEALSLAESKELDLIEISPNAVPPVAKVMSYGKYQYTEQKKQKQTRSHPTETKALQIKIGTGEHDLALKAKKASSFLKEGHRVKINLFLPGRTKYFDIKFLNERLERILNLITEDFKISEPPQKSPKGLSATIERAKPKASTE